MKKLTRRDWEEIYCAVLDKSEVVRKTYSEDKGWIEHMDHILDVLGPDAVNMTKQARAK